MNKCNVKISFNINKISVSGQIFRFNRVSENKYELIECDRRLFIECPSSPVGNIVLYCNKKTYEKHYKKYFDNDYKNLNESQYYIVENKLVKDDKFLKECVSYGSGIRILNQDRWEMLISFIISQRKSIKAIKTSIEKLCRLCGKKMKDEFGYYYAFPTAKEILKHKDKLCNCGLGYRCEYIIDACEKTLSSYIDLYSNKTNELTDIELLDNLMQIKGVGIKVASCVALFGFHRLSICPIDVWIKRVLDIHYNGKIPEKYKKYAGLIQQYWFIRTQNLKTI